MMVWFMSLKYLSGAVSSAVLPLVVQPSHDGSRSLEVFVFDEREKRIRRGLQTEVNASRHRPVTSVCIKLKMTDETSCVCRIKKQ